LRERTPLPLSRPPSSSLPLSPPSPPLSVCVFGIRSGADSFVNVVIFSENARVLLPNSTTLVRANTTNVEELVGLVQNIEVKTCFRVCNARIKSTSHRHIIMAVFAAVIITVAIRRYASPKTIPFRYASFALDATLQAMYGCFAFGVPPGRAVTRGFPGRVCSRWDFVAVALPFVLSTGRLQFDLANVGTNFEAAFDATFTLLEGEFSRAR